MKRFILLISGLALLFDASAQDIHFSQFDQAAQQINPATTGVYRGYQRLILNYRNQWSSVGSPYNTMGGSFDMPIQFGSKVPARRAFSRGKQKAKLGLGVHFYKDIAGDASYGITNLGLSLAGNIPIDESNRAGVGLLFGAGQRSGNFEALQFQSQWDGSAFDPTIASGEGNRLNTSMFFDLGVGAYWRYELEKKSFSSKQVMYASLGGAMYHINKPTMQFIAANQQTLIPKLIVHGDFRYDFKESGAGLIPSFFYAKQGPHQEITGGLMVRAILKEEARYTSILNESALSFGIHYRHKDAIIPRMLLELSDYRIGFSYDFNISELSEVSNGLGAFEVSFSWVNVRNGLLHSKGGRRYNRL